MARRSRSNSSSRARPSPPPARAAAPPAKTQQQAAPVPAQAPPAQVPMQAQPQAPGLFGQMAATAGGVAVGHAMGNAITGLFSSGSSSHDQVAQPVPQQQQEQTNFCQIDKNAFMKCLEQNADDVGACQYYFNMYKDCMTSHGAPL